MVVDEVLAVATMEAICDAATPEHFGTMLELIERHSMQWLVDAYQARHPNVIAISIPSMLSWFPDGVDGGMIIGPQRRTWQEVKESVRRSIESFLR